MVTKLDVPVSVEAYFDHYKRAFTPKQIWWSGKNFAVTTLGLHHTYREGRTLHHVFSLISNEIFFRLELNSDTLCWCLKEVSDGLPN